jgi:hypothetical protein
MAEGHTMLIGLVGRTNTNGFVFGAWMKIIIPDGQTTWLVTERVDPSGGREAAQFVRDSWKRNILRRRFTARAANTPGRDNAAQLSGNQKSWRRALSLMS